MLMMKHFSFIENGPNEGLLGKLRGNRNLFQEKRHAPR